MKRWSLLAAWLVTLLVVTALTWQIVSAADDRVSDRPVAPLDVGAPVLPDPSTTAPPAPATTRREEPPPSTITSLTEAAPWRTRSVETRGGTVVLRYREGEVSYQSATPAPGFQVEVDEEGPPEIEVEFESEEAKVEIRAAWRDGDLAVDISSREDEGDD